MMCKELIKQEGSMTYGFKTLHEGAEYTTEQIQQVREHLNALSQKLYITLTDLQNVNQQLQKDIAYEKELEQTQKNLCEVLFRY